jgi:hypothetical protein
MRSAVRNRFGIQSRTGALLGVAAALTLIAGCGSSESSTKAGKPVTPSAYVGQVCTSVASWYGEIKSRSATLESALGSNANTTKDKQALESYIAVALSSTEATTNALRSAGIPQVKNGQKIASTLVSAFERALSTLQAARGKVPTLQTKNATQLLGEVRKIGASVGDLPLTLSSGLSGLSSPELNKAAEQSQVCRSVGTRVGGS